MMRIISDKRGFTLIEVLVTTSLTVTITGIALTSFLQANRAATSATSITDANHNLRVAMNIVIRDLLQTGQAIPTGGIPIPRGGSAADVLRPGPVGAELTFPPEWETLPAVIPGPGLGPLINGVATDLVSLLRADNTIELKEPFQTIASDGSSITVPSSMPIDDDRTGIKPGDLIYFQNGHGNAMQEVTAVSGQTIMFSSAAESKLNQPWAPEGSVTKLNPDGGQWPMTTITRVLLVTYYIVDSSNGGGEIPALVRRVNFGPERTLALGIENLQLTWDLVDGVNNPANVDEPEEPNTPHQIRKANLHMGARSIDPTSTGAILHASLTTQVSLRSLAFVDRYK